MESKRLDLLLLSSAFLAALLRSKRYFIPNCTMGAFEVKASVILIELIP